MIVYITFYQPLLLQVYYGWRNVTVEFLKRLDPELPFFYYTSTDRFYEGPLPCFNDPVDPASARKLRRPPRRELLGSYVGRRISLAPRGAGSIRATFHNAPVDLPPVPNSSMEVFRIEYSYSRNM